MSLIVVELGAGTALPSLLAAAYGHVALVTDLKKVLTLTYKCLGHNPDLKGKISA
jgi:hypothetical protein